MTVIIVESPAKARKIKSFFKDDTIVTSSFVHIYDLPNKSLSIDIDNNFKPDYRPIEGKGKLLKNLKVFLRIIIYYWQRTMIGKVMQLRGIVVKL